MKRKLWVMALAISLGAFTVAGTSSLAFAKEKKECSGKMQGLKKTLCLCKAKSKPAEKSKPEKTEKK